MTAPRNFSISLCPICHENLCAIQTVHLYNVTYTQDGLDAEAGWDEDDFSAEFTLTCRNRHTEDEIDNALDEAGAQLQADRIDAGLTPTEDK